MYYHIIFKKNVKTTSCSSKVWELSTEGWAPLPGIQSLMMSSGHIQAAGRAMAIEHGHRNSGFSMIFMDFPMKHGDFPWQNVNVHQRVLLITKEKL